MDPTLLMAAGASFVAGLLATIVAKLWIKPIARYKISKRKLDARLTDCLAQMEATVAGPEQAAQIKQVDAMLRSARKHAMDLVSCYQADIPYWYRLLLESRHRSPTDALGLLTNLSKIHDPQQVKERIRSVRQAIGCAGKPQTGINPVNEKKTDLEKNGK